MTTHVATADLPKVRSVIPQGDTFLRPAMLTVAFVFGSCWLADQISSLVITFMLLWGPLLVHYMFRAPVHISARLLLLLGLLLEPPDEKPGHTYWTSPLAPANEVLYHGIKTWTGISGISFCLFTLLAVALFLRARRASHARGYFAPPREAWKTWRAWLLGLMGLWIFGVFVRGGSGAPSFWQAIHMLTMGFTALAFLYSIRGPSDFRALGTIIVVVALAKGMLVAWVYWVLCAPLNIKPFYATTHSDSVNFAMAVVVVAARLFAFRDKKSLWRFLLLVPIFMFVIVMNNRRLAFVSVGAGVITTYAVMHKGPLKRRIQKLAFLLAPLLLIYVKVGANSQSVVFKPAVMLNTVLTSNDASSITREIENYNLIATLHSNKLLGTGLGHEYIELVRADDISQAFSLYRYMPHNSILWIWSMGGLIGATILWMIYPVNAYFAARAYRHARDPTSRAATLATLAATMTCFVQDWGDLGLHSYTNSVMFAVCFAVSVKACAAAEYQERMRALNSQPAP